MKYIICSKDINDGVTTDPLKRTELCTELIGPRMRALQLLEEGKITCNDIIVTKKDRFCLYENIFTHIITWQRYNEIIENMSEFDAFLAIDLVDEIKNGYIDTFQRYEKQFPRKIQFSNKIKKSSFKDFPGIPFICFLNRQMDNSKEKNIYLHDLIIELRRKLDIEVFVFGEEFYCPPNENGVYYIKSLESWCSLLSNLNCKAVISPCSGGVYPAFFSGHKDLNVIIIDNLRLTEKHENSPSFYHECVNFTGVKKYILNHIPSVEELIGYI